MKIYYSLYQYLDNYTPSKITIFFKKYLPFIKPVPPILVDLRDKLSQHKKNNDNYDYAEYFHSNDADIKALLKATDSSYELFPEEKKVIVSFNSPTPIEFAVQKNLNPCMSKRPLYKKTPVDGRVIKAKELLHLFMSTPKEDLHSTTYLEDLKKLGFDTDVHDQAILLFNGLKNFGGTTDGSDNIKDYYDFLVQKASFYKSVVISALTRLSNMHLPDNGCLLKNRKDFRSVTVQQKVWHASDFAVLNFSDNITLLTSALRKWGDIFLQPEQFLFSSSYTEHNSTIFFRLKKELHTIFTALKQLSKVITIYHNNPLLVEKSKQSTFMHKKYKPARNMASTIVHTAGDVMW